MKKLIIFIVVLLWIAAFALCLYMMHLEANQYTVRYEHKNQAESTLSTQQNEDSL